MSRTPEPDLQALLAEEPFVRTLARALAAGDADDVAQQTWLLALQHGGAVERPRSWLQRIAHNVAANLRRGDRRRLEREQRAARRERVPSSAELMEREERRGALVRAVDALPASLREVVLLRWFEGLPPREIAVELDLPVTTVWNRLRSALQALRGQLDREHGGDRRAWLVPLLSVRVGVERAVPPAAAATTMPAASLAGGTIAMASKTKIAAVASVLLAAGALVLWPDGSPAAPLPPAHAGAAAPEALGVRVPAGAAPAADPAGAAQRQEVGAAEPAADGTGTLLVRARRGSDRTPAAGETLVVLGHGDDRLFDTREVRTDAGGEARIEGLAPGTVTVELLQNPQSTAAEIAAGKVTELDFVLPSGIAIRGRVVDADDRGVAGAEVLFADMGSSHPRVVATTAADGSFAVCDAHPACLVGARARGFTASRLQWPWPGSAPSGAAEVKILLVAGGGVVEGTVTGPGGRPVAGALVRAGSGEIDGPVSSIGMPAVAVPVRTDADGRFRVVGLAVGEQPVVVRARGFAPWVGRCFVAEQATATVPVAMQPGAVCTGLVRGAAGGPAAGAVVSTGDRRAFTHVRAEAAADGTFTLSGLPAGEIRLRARHGELGKAEATVHAGAGATVACTIELSRGLELRGRVQDDGGAPVAGAYVTCAAPGSPASVSSSRTDGEGRFVLANCPDGTGLTVYASLGNEQTRREGVDPRRGEIELRLPRRPPDLPRSARIIGRVVGPDGQPVADAHVAAYGPRGEGGGHGATQSDGTFALGPVPPGQYGVFVRCARFPIVSVPMRELAADATWDTGLLQLVAGGTGLVQVTDAPAGTDVDFTIRGGEAGRRYAGQWISDGLLRTDALAPGDYRVDLRCDGRAAISVAFAVRAGEETRVEARLQPGVLQRFHFARADGRRPSADLVRSVHRGAELLIDRSFAWWNREPVHAPDGAMTHALWLAPGSYRIDAEDGGAAGSAEFTVGEREGQPVRVVLR